MTESSLPGQWLRRYKLFILVCLFLLLVQLLLAYLLPIFGPADDILSSDGQFVSITIGKNALVNELLDDEDNINSNLVFKNKDSSPKLSASAKEQSELNNIGENMPNAVSKQQSNNLQLQLDDLKFRPICDITTKEAISAVYRAHSQSCKETIVNITCAIQKQMFYATELPNYCPNENFISSRPRGCFKDDKKFRLLSGYYTNLKTQNTPEKCIQMCLQSGFVYAGVQYS